MSAPREEGEAHVHGPGSLLAQVADFMTAAVRPRSAGVIAVSGGPDSVALLRLLLLLQRQGGVGRLVVAHLNHKLRGPESDADEAFVHDLSKQLSLPCRGERVDMNALARERQGNLESVARSARYDWLLQIAREEDAAWISTGHSADDQAETVLHRLLRGTGLHGLTGIFPRRALAPGVEVVRPLLTVRRSELMAFLQEENQVFRVDSSNADLAFTRNRIRHELLPELSRQYNPAMIPHLCQLAEQARAAQAVIEDASAQLLFAAELPRAGSLLIFEAARLAAAPCHLAREMFRAVWQREQWSAGDMGFDDWDRLMAVVYADVTAIDLPGRIRARRSGRVVQVGTIADR